MELQPKSEKCTVSGFPHLWKPMLVALLASAFGSGCAPDLGSAEHPVREFLVSSALNTRHVVDFDITRDRNGVFHLVFDSEPLRDGQRIVQVRHLTYVRFDGTELDWDSDAVLDSTYGLPSRIFAGSRFIHLVGGSCLSYRRSDSGGSRWSEPMNLVDDSRATVTAFGAAESGDTIFVCALLAHRDEKRDPLRTAIEVRVIRILPSAATESSALMNTIGIGMSANRTDPAILLRSDRLRIVAEIRRATDSAGGRPAGMSIDFSGTLYSFDVSPQTLAVLQEDVIPVEDHVFRLSYADRRSAVTSLELVDSGHEPLLLYTLASTHGAFLLRAKADGSSTLVHAGGDRQLDVPYAGGHAAKGIAGAYCGALWLAWIDDRNRRRFPSPLDLDEWLAGEKDKFSNDVFLMSWAYGDPKGREAAHLSELERITSAGSRAERVRLVCAADTVWGFWIGRAPIDSEATSGGSHANALFIVSRPAK